MTFLQAVILHCLQKINGERSIYSIYHLLAGKKSSQTIQDAHLYHLSVFFKTLPNYKRQQFDKHIHDLCEQSYLSIIDPLNTKYMLTEQGIQAYTSFLHKYPLPKYVHGWRYQDTSIQMWNRLTLLIQALSHLNHSVSRYYPIIRDQEVLTWVKKYLINYSGGRSSLSENLYKELHSILAGTFPENPSIIIARFSGLNMIGLTTTQTAEQLGLEESEYHFRFLNGLHYMVQTIVHQKDSYPMMDTIIKDIYQPIPFTKSTLRTYEMLQQGLSIADIANVRHLKKNTIEDHIIEIAFSDRNFSIDPFINRLDAEEIIKIARELGQKQLKPIKEVKQNSTYFQIRLVLAKLGEMNE